MPSAEFLVTSPLSKFIQFTAINCGCAGTSYELIANWVHSSSLKAKTEVSKSDTPNWRQAMSGPFREKFWTAACKELETLEDMNAWEVVDRTDNMNVIDSIWAFKLKFFLMD